MRLILFATLFIGIGTAVAEDVAGAADHPLVPRYEGSEILKQDVETFTDFGLPTARVSRNSDDGILALEGRLTRTSYRTPAKRSVLEVFRNYEAALAAAGFETLFACERADCGDIRLHVETDTLGTLLWGSGEHRFLSARLPRPEGDVYLSLYVTRNGSGGPSKDRAMVQLDLVEIAALEQKMVVLDAPAMARDLDASGRIAVYGINFDFDSAALRADSSSQLEQIAGLLQADPALRLLVVGHTDASGAYDYNLDLSGRRAASVVAALVSDYGVAGDRLMPVGVGMAAPVASNDNDAGRALNRRVELVKR
jgi:OmpA-OmpF porin, OOP family